MKHDEPHSSTRKQPDVLKGSKETTKNKKIHVNTTLNVLYLLLGCSLTALTQSHSPFSRIVLFLGWVNPVTLPFAAAEHPKLYQWWLFPPKIKLAWTLPTKKTYLEPFEIDDLKPNKIIFPQYPNYELLQAGGSIIIKWICFGQFQFIWFRIAIYRAFSKGYSDPQIRKWTWLHFHITVRNILINLVFYTPNNGKNKQTSSPAWSMPKGQTIHSRPSLLFEVTHH